MKLGVKNAAIVAIELSIFMCASDIAAFSFWNLKAPSLSLKLSKLFLAWINRNRTKILYAAATTCALGFCYRFRNQVQRTIKHFYRLIIVKSSKISQQAKPLPQAPQPSMVHIDQQVSIPQPIGLQLPEPPLQDLIQTGLMGQISQQWVTAFFPDMLTVDPETLRIIDHAWTQDVNHARELHEQAVKTGNYEPCITFLEECPNRIQLVFNVQHAAHAAKN